MQWKCVVGAINSGRYLKPDKIYIRYKIYEIKVKKDGKGNQRKQNLDDKKQINK